MWKNIAKRGWPQLTTWRMRIACWMPKTTNTHSEYVIHIAFSLQQWLHGGTSLLRCTYIACPVYSVKGNCFENLLAFSFIFCIVFV